MPKNATGEADRVAHGEPLDEDKRQKAYERAVSGLSDAIDRAAKTMVIADDSEDYDDAVIVSSHP